MTSRQIRALMNREYRRYANTLKRLQEQEAEAGKEWNKTRAAIQAGCKHRKVSHSSGGPYERTETTCDDCGKVVK